MDHVFFLSRTDWKKAREENQYDLVIVGTGFCGLATAHRALERNPHCRILMIERGTFFLPEPTTNSLLQIVENGNDAATWQAMDRATFRVLEEVLSPGGHERVEYWHGDPDHGSWQKSQPAIEQRRVDALVHESSTLHIGADQDAPVDLDYRLKGSQNVYITGGGLWPQGGSWNPTLTMVALAMDLADQLVPLQSTADETAEEAADQSARHQEVVTPA